MKTNTLVVSFLALLFFTQCSSSQKISELQFGSWGGVTGKAINYTLTADGKVFRTEASGTKTVLLATLTPQELKDVMSLVKKIGYKKVQVEQPGNMNYFIHFKTAKQTYISQWSSGPHEKLDELYALLMKYTSKR